MMTGPEHYTEAERLLALAGEPGRLDSADLTARAAVHAALADTAVLALTERDAMSAPDRQAWQVVASEAFADGRCPVCSRNGSEPCADPAKGEPLEFWHRARRRGRELRGETVPENAYLT